MKDPDKLPSYNDPIPTEYEKGTYPPEVLAQTASAIAPPPAVGPPQVVAWYKLYAGVMAVLYLACTVLGFLIMRYSSVILASTPNMSAGELQVRAVITALIGIVCFVAFVIALVLPKSPGAWVYHLVMIVIGLGNCLLWLATIPLMVAWLKPETQRWFGRMDAGGLPPAGSNGPPIPPA